MANIFTLKILRKYVETRHYFKLPLQSSAAFPMFLLLSFDSLLFLDPRSLASWIKHEFIWTMMSVAFMHL